MVAEEVRVMMGSVWVCGCGDDRVATLRSLLARSNADCNPLTLNSGSIIEP
jgi:hypothetical protein